ncbi:MAG: hypothetical protein ACYSSP_08645 [Planctomycetota bacterium]|jgi:uncharacterized protein (UPF0333 family)
MKEFKILLLTALLIMSGFIYGCMVDSSSHTHAMSKQEREQFAEMVAEKVLELQRQQHSHDLDYDPD